ncbi:MAG: DUF4190 domain-containing protein [Actinomycetia bacterium]|nr:DUF4190 domain-containing protein [Actinomycetes bacterium]
MNDKEEVEEVKSEIINAEQKPGVMAIVSLILGIVAVLCCWIPFLNFILGIAAIVLGILELKNIKKKSTSDKGKVMAIVGIVLGGIIVVWGIVSIITLGAAYLMNMPRMYQSW